MTQDHTGELTKGGWYCRGLLREVSRFFQGVPLVGLTLSCKEKKGKWDALMMDVRWNGCESSSKESCRGPGHA